MSVKKSRIQHGRLLTAVNRQLKRNGVSVDDVASLLNIDLNNEEFNTDSDKKLQSAAGLITNLRLKGYMPLYYLEVLEMLIDEFAEECQADLDDYKCNYLQPYLKGCVENGPFKEDSLVHLYLEIDREWDTLEKLDVQEVTKKLAAIVEIPEDKLVIECTLHISDECNDYIYGEREGTCLTNNRISTEDIVSDGLKEKKELAFNHNVVKLYILCTCMIVCELIKLYGKNEVITEVLMGIGQTLYELSLKLD